MEIVRQKLVLFSRSYSRAGNNLLYSLCFTVKCGRVHEGLTIRRHDQDMVDMAKLARLCKEAKGRVLTGIGT